MKMVTMTVETEDVNKRTTALVATVKAVLEATDKAVAAVA